MSSGFGGKGVVLVWVSRDGENVKKWKLIYRLPRFIVYVKVEGHGVVGGSSMNNVKTTQWALLTHSLHPLILWLRRQCNSEKCAILGCVNGATTPTRLGLVLVLFAWELTSPPLGSIINLKHAPSLSTSRSTNERHLYYFSPLLQKQIPKPKKGTTTLPIILIFLLLNPLQPLCHQNYHVFVYVPEQNTPMPLKKNNSQSPVSLFNRIKCVMEHCERAHKPNESLSNSYSILF